MNSFTRSIAVPVLTALVLAFISLGCGSSGGRKPAVPSNQVAEPSVDRPSGYFVDSIDVTISPGTAGTFGDTIVYTTDSTDPSCADGPAYASTTVTISSIGVDGTVTTIKAVACMDSYDDSDILVATYTELLADTRVNSGAGLTPIQDAINAATTGDVIYIPPGTYTENNGQVTINKRVTLIGAGSGAYGNSITTITDQPTGSVITITSGGASATSRLAIRNLRVTGSTGGGGNAGAGILINSLDGHIEFDNVSVVANSGYGIGFNPASSGNTQDIVIKNSYISSNGSMGFRIPTYVGNIDGLYIDNCVFQGNGSSGAEFLQLGVANADSTNIFLTNSIFIGNASGVSTASDVMFTEFGGNAIISTVSITSSGSDSGIRISGSKDDSYSPRPGLFTAGNITLSNIDIGGFQQANGSYPSGALVITRYLGLGNLSMSNVNLTSTAPNGLFLGTIAAGASTASGAGIGPDLGDLILDGTFTDDIRLGKHGNSGSYVPTDMTIDARGVTFQGALDNVDVEDRIHHQDDDPLLGLVVWTTP